MRHGTRLGGWLLRAAAPVALATVVGGCAMPNSSNPTLTIQNARMNGDRVKLDMHIDNPSDMDVRVDSIDWSLVFGPLPVADGSWQLDVPVPSKGGYDFSKMVAFTGPVLDPSASEVELSGVLNLTTDGNSGEKSLTGAGFLSKAKARR